MERIATRHAIRLAQLQLRSLSRTTCKPLPQQHVRYRSNDTKKDDQVYPLAGYYADILSSRQTPTTRTFHHTNTTTSHLPLQNQRRNPSKSTHSLRLLRLLPPRSQRLFLSQRNLRYKSTSQTRRTLWRRLLYEWLCKLRVGYLSRGI
jgi:hypothetical protein